MRFDNLENICWCASGGWLRILMHSITEMGSCQPAGEYIAWLAACIVLVISFEWWGHFLVRFVYQTLFLSCFQTSPVLSHSVLSSIGEKCPHASHFFVWHSTGAEPQTCGFLLICVFSSVYYLEFSFQEYCFKMGCYIGDDIFSLVLWAGGLQCVVTEQDGHRHVSLLRQLGQSVI